MKVPLDQHSTLDRHKTRMWGGWLWSVYSHGVQVQHRGQENQVSLLMCRPFKSIIQIFKQFKIGFAVTWVWNEFTSGSSPWSLKGRQSGEWSSFHRPKAIAVVILWLYQSVLYPCIYYCNGDKSIGINIFAFTELWKKRWNPAFYWGRLLVRSLDSWDQTLKICWKPYGYCLP